MLFKEKKSERIIRQIFLTFSLVSVVVTFGIIGSLFFGVIPFFSQYSIVDFITGTEWNGSTKFGVIPLLIGTMQIIVISGVISIPIGLLSALFMREYASHKMRNIIKPVLEILAGIPSIVYGFFAYNFINPIVSDQPYSALGAGIAVGVMIIPLVASLSEDALSSVPKSIKEAAYGLGSTKFEVIYKVLVPSALSGIMSSFVLALSRALGETMIVALAAGGVASMSLDPTQPTFTMTGAIVRSSGTDAQLSSLDYSALYAVGLLLFLITLVLNFTSKKISEKYRIKYD